jgi:hypothetical protein
MKYMQQLNWPEFVSASAREANRESPVLIHLSMGIPRDGGLSAAFVEAIKSVNQGLIRRIYFTIPKYYPPDPNKYIRRVDPTTIMSMLKVTCELTNVRFSVVSVKPARILLCASYFNETTASPKLPPLVSGSPKLFAFPTPSGMDDGPPLRTG